MNLFTPLSLPNGTSIRNRIAKAAMEENMARVDNAPSEQMEHLYQTWARGGAGLIITGNVMVNHRAMTGPGGVVLEDDRHIDAFQRWAAAGKINKTRVWMQLNHPGRQMPASLGQQTWAPSAVPVNLGTMSKHFEMPTEMTADGIANLVARFATSAELAEKAGFDGVQIHAAHGYLLSQFLSPLTNHRTDKWGGSLQNRARLLLGIIREVRRRVRPAFSVSVKLNSADFQRGGFNTDDARQVVVWLNDEAVDLVELSGGSYEAPAMQGQARDGRTLSREAFFLDFAKNIRQVAKMPVMVTGGIRRKTVAQTVIDSRVEMVGMATALALAPDLPNDWASGRERAPELRPILWKNKPLASLALMGMVKYQLRKMGHRKSPNPNIWPLWAFVQQQVCDQRRTRHYRKLINTKVKSELETFSFTTVR